MTFWDHMAYLGWSSLLLIAFFKERAMSKRLRMLNADLAHSLSRSEAASQQEGHPYRQTPSGVDVWEVPVAAEKQADSDLLFYTRACPFCEADIYSDRSTIVRNTVCRAGSRALTEYGGKRCELLIRQHMHRQCEKCGAHWTSRLPVVETKTPRPPTPTDGGIGIE